MQSSIKEVPPSVYLQEGRIYHEVGKENPICLPIMSDLLETFGEKLARGNFGTIYSVEGSGNSRVYKVIPQKDLKSEDEIRISKIAARLEVAPCFHRAFLIEQDEEFYVTIEMDHAGKTLCKWMEEFGEETQVPLEIQEKPKQMRMDDPWVVTEIPVKKRVEREVAIRRLYANPETFYYNLFSKIKTLAENCISYGDSHIGNIIPNPVKERGLQLIDFDGAELLPDANQARLTAAKSAYNADLLKDFMGLPNKSEQSEQLIKWFNSL